MLKSLHFAIISGLCASAAGTFGKLCGLSVFEGWFIIRVFFFLCMVLCNGAVWTFFTKGLQYTDSLTATVISSTTNYMLSALSGFLFFNELTSLVWWSGMFLIITGLVLIIKDTEIDVYQRKID